MLYFIVTISTSADQVKNFLVLILNPTILIEPGKINRKAFEEQKTVLKGQHNSLKHKLFLDFKDKQC